jgi:hypothetical protein
MIIGRQTTNNKHSLAYHVLGSIASREDKEEEKREKDEHTGRKKEGRSEVRGRRHGRGKDERTGVVCSALARSFSPSHHS